MRILVVSDTHGRGGSLEKVINLHPEAPILIHLGDGWREVEHLQKVKRNLKIYSVRGNCDYHGGDEEMLLEFEGKKLFVTHGHRYYVKSGLESLLQAAKKQGADIALFGHTHQPLTRYEDDIYLMNPGSLEVPREGVPTYGMVDITPAGIVTVIAQFH